jgi:S1-C subfamily serine protease
MFSADSKRPRTSAGRPLLSNGVLLSCVLLLAAVVLWQNRPRTIPPPEASQPAAPTAAAAAKLASVSSERVESAPESTPAPTRPAAVAEHPAPAKAAVATPPPHAAANPPTVVSDGRSAEELTTIRVFNAASPAVVHIATHTLERDDFSLNVMEVPQGTGTGFVWDQKGHIVTNFHVIEGASGAQVALGDHSTWPAELVGAAPDKDLAVLKIEAPAERLHTIPLGTSGNLQVGQKSLAIGNPFGLDHTLTSGIISALGREIASRTGRPIKGVIQTDAAINPGNSGGPLLDGSGQLIGMTTAIVSPSGAYAGIGFAIPVDTIRWGVPELIAHGKLIRPTLAITVAPDRLTERLGITGVLVMTVEKNSTAAEAGLHPTKRDARGKVIWGDILTALDDVPLRSPNDLLDALERHRVGDEVTLTVQREQQQLRVRLEAAD